MSQPSTKWEYLVVFIHDSRAVQHDKDADRHLDADTYSEKLNRYGEAGWELVSFEWEDDGAKVVLKRPRS